MSKQAENFINLLTAGEPILISLLNRESSEKSFARKGAVERTYSTSD